MSIGFVFHRDDVLSLATFVALAVLTSGYLVGSWRRGKTEAVKEANDLAMQEIELLKVARDRAEQTRLTLEREMRATSDGCKADIARLEGVVEQLRNENAELRSLVMLEKLPPAMTDALTSVVEQVMKDVGQIHADTREALIEHFDRQAEAMQMHFDNQVDANRAYWTETVTDVLHPIEQGMARLLAERDGR
jgi:hypothetical protein